LAIPKAIAIIGTIDKRVKKVSDDALFEQSFSLYFLNENVNNFRIMNNHFFENENLLCSNCQSFTSKKFCIFSICFFIFFK